ncbi:F-box/kelch-repeat protein At3g23880 [Ricinus communis]|uniref:Ubiquitin-protein ligase, putative n=1 Tax=Ricinus communis TaxID=3988 RepID=B9SIG1_RICCO|nr:F-box/kelch-repeat protein At3g23880 [Ricinus communis]EEF36616.1 ubiquitin-protein ligase, putative [Ricinus communis]|eukprot:XP_002525780.1 F-box/kelch-repeat protein At3g23880 [Ricinus communis]
MSIPVELVVEILAKLPVKSLMRFKSVSKSLHSIITDSEFVKLHSGPGRLLLVTSASKFQSITCEVLWGNSSGNHIIQNLDHPWDGDLEYYHDFYVHGSCNGLICLDIHERLNFYGLCNRRDLYLWNPTTNDFKALPTTSDISIMFNNVGFGYDNSIDDYKVVVIDRSTCELKRTRYIMIFTLKTNSWRRKEIQDVKCSRIQSGKGILCNGALHWTSHSETHGDIVLAFNLAMEEIAELPQPDTNSRLDDIAASDGKICLFYLLPREWRVEIWIMKEYGVKASYTKLTTETRDVTFGPLRSLSENGGAAAISSGGKLMKYSLEKAILYDSLYYEIITYNESLVPLNPIDQVG